MDTMEHATRKKVGKHCPELRARVLAECNEPGASVAKVALTHGLNANLVHTWRKQERDRQAQVNDHSAAQGVEFIALPIPPVPTAAVVPDIRIELRRGATTVSITWPGQAAGECATWLQEWLR